MVITLKTEDTFNTTMALFTKPRFTVLICDSGVGGFSVYKKIKQLLPDLHYIYTFDNIAFPYGEKHEKFIIERILRIVTAVQQRYPLALTIIACNTVSSIALYALRKKFSFPIVGVVPAIKPAAHLTVNGVIGLLATHATIKCSYTHELIAQFASKCKIQMLGSTELVELAEAKLHGEKVSLEKIYNILQPWLYMKEFPDTVVLGCTHFSHLKEELLTILPSNTYLVDAGEAIASRTAWLLEHEAPNVKSIGLNKVFCMEFTGKTTRLLPTLHKYGFIKLERLIL